MPVITKNFGKFYLTDFVKFFIFEYFDPKMSHVPDFKENINFT